MPMRDNHTRDPARIFFRGAWGRVSAHEMSPPRSRNNVNDGDSIFSRRGEPPEHQSRPVSIYGSARWLSLRSGAVHQCNRFPQTHKTFLHAGTAAEDSRADRRSV